MKKNILKALALGALILVAFAGGVWFTIRSLNIESLNTINILGHLFIYN